MAGESEQESDILEGFDPKAGGTREQVATYAVREIKRMLGEGELHKTAELDLLATSTARDERGGAIEDSYDQIPVGEIKDEVIDGLKTMMQRHTAGNGKFKVQARVWQKGKMGPEKVTRTLFEIPIAKELSGEELLDKLRKGPVV